MSKHNNLTNKFYWIQLCWLLVSIFLFAGGFIALRIDEKNIVSVSRILGLCMFFAGCLNLFVCEKKNHEIYGAKWLIADGVTAVLLSIFPLFNQMVSPIMIPFFFGMWELFSGILKVIDSSELKEEKIDSWKGFAFIGLIELASGTASLIKPFDDFIGINKVIAIIFFIQCCGFILKTAMYKHLIK